MINFLETHLRVAHKQNVVILSKQSQHLERLSIFTAYMVQFTPILIHNHTPPQGIKDLRALLGRPRAD